uniref:AT3G52170-like helix-turn-helix domain-containing protein n=1 Tax=Lactuca sativa TaxID=4236 RepID=A0A9R1W6M6_LACSA|nr:hypothetical protein LSAT_V11C300122300 [Lactuca sativa]
MHKSNNGDFLSLNLISKEVGGSFYTLSEIVWEIIQENRVLGPPKSSPRDENMEKLDSFLEHNPLGSMSVDGTGEELEKLQDSLRVLDIILRQQAAQMECLLVKQSFFHDDSRNFTDIGGGVPG